MKLSLEQIQKLYDFTRQHYVEYYDLQTELVDHLANAIEEQWQKNPSLSFETALNVEFKKFGVFGFMDVVGQRQKAMNKKYNILVWRHLTSFFRLPQIIGTLLAIVVLFQVLKNISFSKDVASTLTFIILASFLVGVIRMNVKRKKIKKEEGKRWLLKEIIYGYSSLAGMSYLPLQLSVQVEKYNNQIMLFVLSVIIVLMILLEYITFFIIPSKADEYLKQTYPEYEFVC
jgi:hypothetical protein